MYPTHKCRKESVNTLWQDSIPKFLTGVIFRYIMNKNKPSGRNEVNALKDFEYDSETGMPTDEMHFECGLPKYLAESLERMKKSWAIVDSGKKDYHWDICWCELNADINSAEVENLISSKQAWYLRHKYLRMEKPDARSFLKDTEPER